MNISQLIPGRRQRSLRRRSRCGGVGIGSSTFDASKWGFPYGWGYPKSWMVFVRENPMKKWMMTWGTPIYGNPHAMFIILNAKIKNSRCFFDSFWWRISANPLKLLQLLIDLTLLVLKYLAFSHSHHWLPGSAQEEEKESGGAARQPNRREFGTVFFFFLVFHGWNSSHPSCITAEVRFPVDPSDHSVAARDRGCAFHPRSAL